MSAPGLTGVAAWDTSLLDGAVYTLEAVAERLPRWRARLEGVARSLADARCWYGDAAQQAARVLGEVSTVTTAVTVALDSSLDRLWDTARQARTAQELAAQALAEAAASGVTVDEAGGVGTPAPLAPSAGATPQALADHAAAAAEWAAAAERVAALAADALHAAAQAALHAAGSVEALSAVGGTGAVVPADFAGLHAAVGAGLPPVGLPVDRSPGAVTAWWAGLPEPARDTLTTLDPRSIGALDGLPAWARDRANRLLLDRTLADPSSTGYATARAAAAELAAEEAAGRPVQLWVFDPQQGQVAVSYGDLDTAEDVAVLVPGMGNDPDEDLDDLGDRAQSVADAASAAAPAASVATVAWFGYRPPSGMQSWRVLLRGRAEQGGAALAGDLAGLAAARAADPLRPGDSRVTVVAHSYGTVVVDEAADVPGRLAADAVVLNGSPGMENDAAGLEVAEVYEASSPVDPVTSWDHHGQYPTWRDDFGAVELPTGWSMMHGEYYDEGFPTRAAIGEVVVDTYEPA
ncbi:alpha/beta hydrolase [Geodermatophilus sp. URMC 63]